MAQMRSIPCLVLFVCLILSASVLVFGQEVPPGFITHDSVSTAFSGQFTCSPCAVGDTFTIDASEFVSSITVKSISIAFAGKDDKDLPVITRATLPVTDQQNKGTLTIDLSKVAKNGVVNFYGVISHSTPVVETKKIKPTTAGDVTFVYTPATNAQGAQTVKSPFVVVPMNGKTSRVTVSPGTEQNLYRLDQIQVDNDNGSAEHDVLVNVHSGVFTSNEKPVCYLASYNKTITPIFVESSPSQMIIPLPSKPSFKRTSATFSCNGVGIVTYEQLTTNSESIVTQVDQALTSVGFINKEKGTVAAGLTAVPQVQLAPYSIQVDSMTDVLDHVTITSASYTFSDVRHINLKSDYVSFVFGLGTDKRPSDRLSAVVQLLVNDDLILNTDVKLTSDNKIERIPLSTIPDTRLQNGDTISVYIYITIQSGSKSAFTTDFTLHQSYSVDQENGVVGKTIELGSKAVTPTHKPFFPLQYPLKLTLENFEKDAETIPNYQFSLIIDTILYPVDSFSISLATRDYMFIDAEKAACTVNEVPVKVTPVGHDSTQNALFHTLIVHEPLRKNHKMHLLCTSPTLSLSNLKRADEDQILVFNGHLSAENSATYAVTRTWNNQKAYHDGLNPNKHTTLLALGIVGLGGVGLLIFAVLYYRQYKRSKAREVARALEEESLLAEDSLNTA